MTRAEKFTAIGKILNRIEDLRGEALPQRFDRFIDLDVSKVNIKALVEADDETLMHDAIGIFENLQRNPDEPEKSKLVGFVPRVGFAE